MRTAIYGSRPDGHARVIIELLAGGDDLELVGLLDDFPENAQRSIAGLPVLGDAHDPGLLRDRGIEAVVFGFGAAAGRVAAIERLVAAGVELPVVVHPSATVAASAHLGAGCQVLASAVVGPGAELGRGVLLNSGAIAEHDTRIADGAVIYSGAVLTGRVTIGTEAEVGAGAVIVPDVQVGNRSRIGAGAVVVRDVPDDVTVFGVPAMATHP